jgi:hypothetical protein
MKNINCPHCGGQVLQDDRLAGQVVACPACKKPFQMPRGDALPHFAFEEGATGQPTGALASLEPWYYRFLDRNTLAAMWIGVTAVGLIALAMLVAFLVSLGRDGLSLMMFLSLLITFSFLLLILLAIVFGAALTLLAVDAARALREVQRNTTRRS